ncbi:NUDIX hydrolase [Streptomyces sp. NPDC051183]|uniref:nucleotide triphosphate diphosphatase NUDT15 n=1 Tax=Streptomyces sp. NPDC051183 TaxID=3155165 RepID=UPI003444CC52
MNSPAARQRSVPEPNAVVGVGLVVVRADGRVLLGQAHDGRWELPGGKVDPGEGFEQAAARELAEETDLRAAPEGIRILSVRIDAQAGVTRLTAAAVTEAAEGTATVTEPHKIARWQWFAPDAIPDALYAPSEGVIRAWRPDWRPGPAPGLPAGALPAGGLPPGGPAALPTPPAYDYPTT